MVLRKSEPMRRTTQLAFSVLLWLSLLLPPGPGGRATGQTTQVTVTANPLWTDTGMVLSAGQTVTISASGTWNCITGAAVGPDGNPHDFVDYWDAFAFFNIADCCRLLAFVGADPYQGQWGNASFFPQTSGYVSVGSGQTFKTRVAGKLWLGINDDAVTKYTPDNGGHLTATVTIATSDKTAPKIRIAVPTSVYALHQKVAASYTCTDRNSAILACDGPVANGMDIDTATTGPHAFTVIAIDSNGNASSKTVTYMVADVGLTPLSIAFRPRAVGTTSRGHKVALVNLQSTVLNIASIHTSGDFHAPTTTCGSTLPAQSSCTINVVFQPTGLGSRRGGLTVDNDAGSQSVILIGVGR